MSTVKLENKRTAVFGQCMARAEFLHCFQLPWEFKVTPLAGKLSVEKQWHLPSCQHHHLGAARRSCAPKADSPGLPALLCCSPQLSAELARRLLQEGFDLRCLVWLFKYCNECWGNFRHVYPLLWERLKTHVSSYSPVDLLCLCFHMQHAHTLQCGKWGAADKAG